MRKADDFTCLYIDFDSFFARAEQHLRPELRGRPVGVVPLASNHTVLIAASPEAKRFGVKTGTPVKDARVRCPSVVLVVARHDAYVRLHNAIIAVVDDVVPVHKVCSIDEVSCRLLTNERNRAVDIATTIKAKLAERIGPTLTCSIGLAPNELLAKTAAEMEKPNGLVALSQESLPGRLLELELTAIPGIAEGNARRLARAGVTTVRALWALPPAHLRKLWGGVEGERFWAFLHGYDIERQATQRGMFGHSRILAWDWRGPERTEACARLLLVKAMRRMRRENFAASTLSLGLRGEPQTQPVRRWFGEERRTPFCDDHTALGVLARLFAEARIAGPLGRTKKVSVTLYGLVRADAVHDDLLETPEEHRARLRWERLSEITDKLHTRYEAPILTLGPRADLPGGYAGAKIAFGRIPDLADF